MSDVIGPSAQRPHRIREMDFRRPMKFTQEQLRLLEHAHESFCRSASTRLSAELRTEMTLSLATIDQLPYSVIMAEQVPRQALIVVLRAEPFGTEVALAMEIPTALKIINRVLGGRIETDEQDPSSLSELEMAVALRSLSGLIGTLSATWMDLCNIEFSPATAELSPFSVQIAPPSEPTLMLTFSAEFDDNTSLITLVLPHRSLLPIVDQLTYARGDEDQSDDDGGESMRRALSRVQVPLRAELGAATMPVADVLALGVGDVVRLPQRAAEGLTVLVGDQPLYRAEHGEHDGKLAVQIVEQLQEQIS